MSDAARKMQLVEVGELERLQQRQVKEYDPTLNAMARAQFELDSILNTKTLTDEDKLSLLSNAQLRFKKLKASMGPSLSTDVAIPAPAPAPPSPPPPPPPSPPMGEPVDDELMQFLDRHPAVIRSNAAGQLVFRNKPIAGSSFEQITDAAVNGGNFSQPGFREFSQGLRMLHMPRVVLKNESLQKAYDYGTKKSRKSASISPPIKAARSDDDDDKPISTLGSSKQKGTGFAAPPPGKRPRILFLYK